MKKIFDKKTIITIIVCGIVFSSLSAFATTYLSGSYITYDNSDNNLTSTNVQSAIDELNTKTNIGDATSDNIASGKTALVGGKTITGTGADISNAISSQWNSIATDSDLIAKGYSGVNDLASLKTAINTSITSSYNEGYSKGNIDGAANSQAVTINYHSHSREKGCYCNGTYSAVDSRWNDRVQTTEYRWKCSGCGAEEWTTQMKSTCYNLVCSKNSTSVDSVVVGSTVYTTG